ncbi:glycosyltransferase [Anaerotruncus sp. DFI.9.16]|uniref:glycosyltransferase n=1 Tax=Anaerotruncus sp. DFI.9.16 TaxID=2965275 RepID=UPI00210BA077|nr:glycosyltransferase [Anaerotruncus sp. DFI.9.16]
MNILHIAPSVRIGGVGSLLAGLLPRLDRERFRCEVLAEADPAGPGANRRALEAAGIPVRPIPPRVGNLRENLRAVDAALCAGSYDAVHLHLEEWSALYALLARRRGVPARIVHAHLAGVRLPFRFTARRLARPAALALLRGFMRREATHRAACSADAGRWLFGDAPFTTLPNAVDTARFGFSADVRRRTRAALGLGEAFTVGCAARFDQQKNLPFLLALFAELRRREPDALLLLAGDGEEGPALRAEAGRLGIAEAVRFLGAREDVPALLQAMDAFALPTRYEGFGIALLEAQAAGLPCFAPDGAVPREAAVTGLLRLLPPGLSAAGWAGEILAAKGLPRRCRAEEVEAAGCGAETAARRLEALYERCRAERGRGL